jgi:hypothetical protein
MMHRKGQESFLKRERKYREKYGEGLFQRKFIKKYKAYIHTTQWVLPLASIIGFLNAGIYYFNQDGFSDTRSLIVVGVWLLNGFVWMFSSFYHYLSFYGFVKKRISVWEKELKVSSDNG